MRIEHRCRITFLLQERVKAGLRNAKAKGYRLGRPRVVMEASRIAELRVQGHSWGTTIRRETGVPKGTAQRGYYNLHETPAASAR